MSTRTAVLPMKITCPEWCTISAEDHAANLENWDGMCIHSTPWIEVEDKSGFKEPLLEPRFATPVELSLTTFAFPSDGREGSSPVIHLEGGNEVTISQALDFAKALTDLVETYRNNGGVE